MSKKEQIAKIPEQNLKIEILKLLEKGYYPAQIIKKLNQIKHIIYREVKWLRDKKYIKRINRNPDLYELSKSAKMVIKYGFLIDYKTIREQEKFEKENKLTKDWILKQSIHRLSFFDKLYSDSIPMHILNFKRLGVVKNQKGISFKKTKMTNWPRSKVIVYFPYYKFGGITSVEFNLHSVVYNFDRNKEDSTIESKESLIKYFQDRVKDCYSCRAFLKKNGFKIKDGNPEIYKKFHIVLETEDDLKALANMGKYFQVTLLGKEKYSIEASQEDEGDFEMQTKDLDKPKSLFDVPKIVEKVENKIDESKDKIDLMEKNLIKQTEILDKLANKTIQNEKNIEKLTDNIGKLTNIFEKILTRMDSPQDPIQQKPTEDKFSNEFYS